MTIKPKFVRVLQAMLNGVEVELSGYTYGLCEGPDGNPKFALAFKTQTFSHLGDEGKDVWMEAQHMTVNGFVQECESLSEEEMVRIAFSSVMRSTR